MRSYLLEYGLLKDSWIIEKVIFIWSLSEIEFFEWSIYKLVFLFNLLVVIVYISLGRCL